MVSWGDVSARIMTEFAAIVTTAFMLASPAASR